MIYDLVTRPWPWWIAGPLLGLTVPFVYWYGGRKWGVSSNLKHLCAAMLPTRGIEYFRYDWWKEGAWHLSMAAGMVVGGFVGGHVIANPVPYVDISMATVTDLHELGLENLFGLVPPELVSWDALLSLSGLAVVGGGGFLVGFGARYANGCTSGHAVSGLANVQRSSLVAVIGFFVGGLISTHILLPFLVGGGG